MPTYRLSRYDDTFDVTDEPSWTDGSTVFAGSGNDALTIPRAWEARIFAGPGDDEMSVRTAWHAIINGGSGDDSMDINRGYNAIVRGGGGDDTILYDLSYSNVSGGAGDDVITCDLFSSSCVLQGGRGDDLITVIGNEPHLNRLYGGDGNDVLTIGGFRANGNFANGGAGDDLFDISSNQPRFGFTETGCLITGGPGHDGFLLNSVTSTALRSDPNANGRVDEGETLEGVMDVITDFEAGEELQFGATQLVTGPVEIDQGLYRGQIIMGEDEYAMLRGDYVDDGRFRVGRCGNDTLILYGRSDSPGAGAGSLVLLDETNPQWSVLNWPGYL